MTLFGVDYAPDALADLALHGGFTRDPLTGATGPSTGYAVSLAGNELVIPFAELTTDDIAAHAATIPAGAYQGGWLDGQDVYLDASIVLSDVDAALDLARSSGQLAIFDLTNGRDIRLTVPA